MRAGTALFVYVVFVFAGAALIAPWIYFGIQDIASTSSAVNALAHVPFRRIVNRCLLAMALVGIWPLFKALRLRSWEEIGVRKNHPVLREWGQGFLIGTVLAVVVAAGAAVGGAAQWDATRPFSVWPRQILSSLATALIVAPLEEILFRGAIYTALRKAWNNAGALWISSAIYAIMHFFARPENPAHVQWNSGFEILLGMLKGFTEAQSVIPAFLNLTLLGVIFALAFRKSGALFLPIGIHAGVIFWVEQFAASTNSTPGANLRFWGSEKLADGWFGFLLLIVMTACFARRGKERA